MKDKILETLKYIGAIILFVTGVIGVTCVLIWLTESRITGALLVPAFALGYMVRHLSESNK